MEYTIVSGATDLELIKRVTELFETGWETEGGVTIAPDGRFYQAMIRFDDEGEENSTSKEMLMA